MCSDRIAHSPHSERSTPWAIEVQSVSKRYLLFKNPKDRLKEFILPKVHRFLPWIGQSTYAKTFWSLKDVSLQLAHGEVLGIIGVNGAGKSSLLQLICGVLEPSFGQVKVNGRIAALLELGAGFNPEFSGRENITLNATLLGLSAKEIKDKTPEIIAFSGIEEFIDQPVKTYSSGMYVRLAFAIATSVDPDILVIDEALSVGDGAFARKSFDRIMDLKSKGVTILFCSHSIYQVEALCEKAIWLNKGEVQAFGQAREVAQAYNQFLDQLSQGSSNVKGSTDISSPADEFVSPTWQNSKVQTSAVEEGVQSGDLPSSDSQHTARLKSIDLSVGGVAIQPFGVLQSLESDLAIHVKFKAGLNLPSPNVGVVISDALGKAITSCSNFYDEVSLVRDADGLGELTLVFPKIQLLRGRYLLHVYLLCERAIHIYDSALWGEFEVTQKGLELGVVSINRRWEIQTMVN